MRSLRLSGWLALLLLLTPLFWAAWVSFTPDELLRPPLDHWSLRWYSRFLHDARWTRAFLNSLLVASGSTLLALVIGTLAAVAGRNGLPGLRSIVLLPLCIPPLVLGIGLLPLMHLLGLWGSYLGLLLAHSLIGMPLVFLTVHVNLQSIPDDLEAAARGLGAGRFKTFVRVTLPLCKPGLCAGAALAFVLSLNEFFLALFVAAPETETLPRVIWPELRYSLSPLVAVASMLTLIVTSAVGMLVAAVGHAQGWWGRS